MSATEQRSGFRLPWATDPKPRGTVEPEVATPLEPAPAASDPASLVWPEVDRARKGTTPSGRSTATTAEVAEVAGSSDDRDGSAGAGSAGAGSAGAGTASPAGPDTTLRDATTVPRRDNPLVQGLVRAMRDAANAARAEAAAKAEADAAARVEALRSEAAASSTELRKQADDDVAAIRDWSRAQLARIREEAQRRTSDRRARLDRDLEVRTVRLDARIGAVAAVTADFEARMAAFYDVLLTEEDPARLAGLAERLPEPPGFDDLDAWVSEGETLDPDAAAAAEALAMSGLDDLEPIDFDALGSGAAIDSPADGAAESGSPGDVAQARLLVTGLVSVASIAAFKRALAGISGVRSVSVISGPDSEFVFTVSHGPETDLSAGVSDLSAFHPTLDVRADGTILASVAEPDDHV